MKKILHFAVLTAVPLAVFILFKVLRRDNTQIKEAYSVIRRVLPEHAKQFQLEMIENEEGKDIFEIEPSGEKIIIRGSSGIAICSGFNHYLVNFCNASYNWRCGNNINIKGELPLNFKMIRKTSQYNYRYIFNYCTFSYSMAFWDWEQWERMIDWMALNGINMPLAPMGQELIWQRVYKKYGLNADDLKDFFVGPAYNAFGRMGCIDGFGGPLPQSWIDNENVLQKKILERERGLGMTPVLQGFTGHIPAALAKKNPNLKVTSLKWLDFPETTVLDWEDPLFGSIGKEFINEMKKEYGTDHLYAIDQFIEMNPLNGDTAYLKNMSRTIINYVTEADPEGRWVIQTWPFKELIYWNKERTKAYFSGVPDDRMIALELMGESWHYTGWYKHDGWYGKPWVWSVISNFGDNVSMFGGLSLITANFKNALESPDKGDLSGLGLMMEGLDYNPVTYSLVTGMMWENNVPDINEWKQKYLRSRYGILNREIMDAWDPVFSHYYSLNGEGHFGLFEKNPIIERPYLVLNEILPSESALSGAARMLALSDELGSIDAYRYDLVNLFRQVFGQYAGHLLFGITSAYRQRDLSSFDTSVEKFNSLAYDIENLMETREEFLFGKWIADSRERATNEEEAKLYEWNARAIITTWGGDVLYGYAQKDWAGLYTSYYLPKWNLFFNELRKEITTGEKLDYDNFLKSLKEWEKEWNRTTGERLSASPAGDPVALAAEMWQKYRK